MNSRSYSAVRLTWAPEVWGGRRPGEGSAIDAADHVHRVRGQRPARAPGSVDQAVHACGGEPVEDAARGVDVALLDAGAGTDDRLVAHAAPIADDRGRLHDGAAADVAAVDHGAGPDDDVVLDEELVLGQ